MSAALARGVAHAAACVEGSGAFVFALATSPAGFSFGCGGFLPFLFGGGGFFTASFPEAAAGSPSPPAGLAVGFELFFAFDFPAPCALPSPPEPLSFSFFPAPPPPPPPCFPP
jgi:hypothetical protein